jgi:hypothetical protein
MQNSLDEKIINLYRSIKKEKGKNELYKLIDYSFLKIFLHIKGREKYIVSKIYFLKRILFSFKEVFNANKRLNKVLKNNSFNFIIVINESSHLKHAIPLSEDIRYYKPLFITNKIRYIKVISSSFNTDDIVYIPKIITKKTKFKTQEIRRLLSEFDIDSSFAGDIVSMMNFSYKNYKLTKKIIETIIKNNKIQFVYVFNDLLFTGRVIVDVCNNVGIKTYYLMHGLLFDGIILNFHICDSYLVFGDHSRELLLKKGGINSDKIIIIGAAYLEEQLNAKQSKFFEKEIIDKLPKGRKIVLVLLSGAGHSVGLDHHKAILELLEELIEHMQDEYFFLFKLHNKDKIAYYKKIISKGGSVYKFDHFQGKDTIFDWIKTADVIITGASTTALEAMYMGKPVLTIDLKGEFDHETGFIKQGATYHCRTKEEVYKMLDNLLENNFSISHEAKGVVNQYFADFSNIRKFHKEVLPQQSVS